MLDVDNESRKNETFFINMMYGTYADVLFILFPFLVIALQRLWVGEGIGVLRTADLSVASAILAGMSVGKFVLGLISDRNLGRYKERIVFFIAVTLFFVLGPALILTIKIVGQEEVPSFVVFVQPVLLIFAITLYSTSVSISNILTRASDRPSDDKETSLNQDLADKPEPLYIQGKEASAHSE